MTLKEFKEIKQPEIGSLLTIANCESQMRFLTVLSNSQQFIEWLQAETNGNCISPLNIISMNWP